MNEKWKCLDREVNKYRKRQGKIKEMNDNRVIIGGAKFDTNK